MLGFKTLRAITAPFIASVNERLEVSQGIHNELRGARVAMGISEEKAKLKLRQAKLNEIKKSFPADHNNDWQDTLEWLDN